MDMLRILVLSNGDHDGRLAAVKALFDGRPKYFVTNKCCGVVLYPYKAIVEVVPAARAIIDHDYVFGRSVIQFAQFVNLALSMIEDDDAYLLTPPPAFALP